MKKIIFTLILILGLNNIGFAAEANFITQYGITYFFDKAYETGTFANGDYWVVGPVVITRITPDYDGENYGWEVNPTVGGKQGFCLNCYPGNDYFNSSLVPALPYTALPNQSIVKTIPSGEAMPCIKTATVLTVLSEIPPGNGLNVFRPPYVESEKPLIPVSLKTEILPSLAPVANAPSLNWVYERYKKVQLDHKFGGVGSALHPSDHMPDYGGDIGRDNGDAALRLMLNDPLSEKMPALITYIQYGIDLYYMAKNGHTWPDGGGHRPGQKLPISFAAVMLDNEDMKNIVINAEYFHEDKVTLYSEKVDKALYGSTKGLDFNSLELHYWQVLASYIDGNVRGYRSYADPYEYIDGGPVPGSSYQFCCTSQPWKGSVLAVSLMPEMRNLWMNTTIFNYTERWVTAGIWSQEDPCAPYDGNWENYGITFGPDPANPGDCIRDNNPSDGIGRFPDLHGTGADSGYRSSKFQKEMWLAYWNTTSGSAPQPPTGLKIK